MMWFKNMSIRLKLLIPVGIMAVLMLTLGIVSVNGSNNIMKASEEISTDYSVSIEQIGDISTAYQSLRRVAFAHIVATEENTTVALEDEAESLKSTISNLCETFERTLDPGEEEDAFLQFEEDYEAYLKIYDKILESSREGRDEEATILANTDLREAGTSLTAELDNLRAANKTAMDKAIKRPARVYKSSVSTIITFVVIGFIALILVIYISWTWVCKRLININKQLREVIDTIEDGKGDLTKRVQCFCTDEIGTLADGINTFIKTLQGIMGQINTSSTQLDSIVSLVTGKVNTANTSSVDISAVMEELSASMEEIASTVADIKGNVSVVDGNVINLAKESQNLYDYANDMRKRAEEMENSAIDSKQSADNVINDILEKLKRAIEHSKSVEQVNSLTDEILNIAGQTNLLSLNASIEAARAGEAGRGFAVVADEISQLSNSSREAASNIQEINNMVVRAVNELIESSNSMVKYISEVVLNDYDNFVTSGKQYNDDASHVNEIVAGFNEMSSELKTLMQSIMEAVEGINSAVDESAHGVANAANNTTDLVKDIEQIEDAMNDNQQVAGDLTDEAKRFINL